MNKNGENRKIRDILSFSMSIPAIFHLKNCIYLSTKQTGIPFHSLLTPSNIPISGVCQSKVWKICIKTFQTGKLCVFCHFRCQFETFIIQTTEIISSLKNTGQRVATLANVSNIPIHEVCRNCDRK